MTHESPVIRWVVWRSTLFQSSQNHLRKKKKIQIYLDRCLPLSKVFLCQPQLSLLPGNKLTLFNVNRHVNKFQTSWVEIILHGKATLGREFKSGVQQIFCKEPDSKYVWLCRPTRSLWQLLKSAIVVRKQPQIVHINK